MSVLPPEDSSSPNTSKWFHSDDLTLIKILDDDLLRQYASDKKPTKFEVVFEPTIWQTIANALVGSELVSESKPKDAEECKSRFEHLIGQYEILDSLLHHVPGAEWDYRARILNLPEGVWEEFRNSDNEYRREAAKWENRTNPSFRLLYSIKTADIVSGADVVIREISPIPYTQRVLLPAKAKIAYAGLSEDDPIIWEYLQVDLRGAMAQERTLLERAFMKSNKRELIRASAALANLKWEGNITYQLFVATWNRFLADPTLVKPFLALKWRERVQWIATHIEPTLTL